MEAGKSVTDGTLEPVEAFAELGRGVYAALETYSNVHRGSGYNSMVTTYLYDQAREIVLEYLGLDKKNYTVIFCTPRRAAAFKAWLQPGYYHCLSDRETGLSLGIRALAVKRKALPGGKPFQSGGGTASLISKEWVIWTHGPDKFEAGTPAIVNIITFAKALRLMQQYGKDIFRNAPAESLSANGILFQDDLAKFTGPELLAELRKSLIGRGIRVPSQEGLMPYINLDNGASTPTFLPVWNAFLQTLRQPANVKQEIIAQVKTVCMDMLGAPPSGYDLIFTSNTTEAINLLAESLGRESNGDIEPVVLNTILEHSSNDLPWRTIPGCSLIRLTVDKEGFVDLKELESVLKAYNQNGQYGNKRIRLVTVSAASNVLGICNNFAEISRIVHRYGTHLIADAAQLVAHRRVSMEECGIDFLAFSAHKVYAPFGCGVLVARKELLKFHNEELDRIRESGEENVGGIAALGKSLLLLQRVGMDLVMEEERKLTAVALRGMAGIEGLTVYGVTDPDSPGFAHKLGVIVFAMKNMFSNKVAEELSLRRGIGIRYGCHCAHIIVKHLLHVGPSLERFQWLILKLFPKTKLPGLARISLGIENSEEEIDTVIRVLEGMSKKPVKSAVSHAAISKPAVKKQMKEFIDSAAIRVYSLNGGRRKEDGGRKSEVRRRRTEVGGQRSENE